MDSSIRERQHLIEIINNLPDDVLGELGNFIDYLNYKSSKQQLKEKSSATFLLSVAKIGTSGENNISERDEEILASEVEPIRGWGLNSHDQL